MRRFSDRNEAECKRGRALAAKQTGMSIFPSSAFFESGNQIEGLAVRAEPAYALDTGQSIAGRNDGR